MDPRGCGKILLFKYDKIKPWIKNYELLHNWPDMSR